MKNKVKLPNVNPTKVKKLNEGCDAKFNLFSVMNCLIGSYNKVNRNTKFRIREAHYDNGRILFFSEKSQNGKKWETIQNINGYESKESALNDIETYKQFYNTTKVKENKIHLID